MLKKSTRIKILEKYFRLLSPKTTNFDAIGGGSHGALTAQDVCVAMSYAKLSTVQVYLVELCVLNRNSLEQIKTAAQFIHSELIRTNQAEMSTEHELSIFVALVELCKVPGDYKPSVRSRAIIGGVSKDMVQRKLNTMIDEFRSVFRLEMRSVEGKIKNQLK